MSTNIFPSNFRNSNILTELELFVFRKMFGFPRRGTDLSCLFPPALFSSGMPPFLPHPRPGNVVMEITRPRNALEQLPPLPKTFFLVFFLVVESKQLVRLMNVYSIVNDKFFEPSFLTLSNTSLSSFNVKREFVRREF